VFVVILTSLIFYVDKVSLFGYTHIHTAHEIMSRPVLFKPVGSLCIEAQSLRSFAGVLGFVD
jgi:hypothetical protein